jgi:hypothetical protein
LDDKLSGITGGAFGILDAANLSDCVSANLGVLVGALSSNNLIDDLGGNGGGVDVETTGVGVDLGGNGGGVGVETTGVETTGVGVETTGVEITGGTIGTTGVETTGGVGFSSSSLSLSLSDSGTFFLSLLKFIPLVSLYARA